MRPGQIVFIEGDSWISKIIKKLDGGRFTHVAIAITTKEMIEAQRFRVVGIVPEYDLKKELIDLKLTPKELELMMIEANRLIGKKYDYMQIFGYILMKLTKGKFKRINSPKKLICSELISRVLYAAGIVEQTDWLYDLTPNQLYDYLKYIEKTRSRG